LSGSDDGNWFLWDKDTGDLKGIWEGDDECVVIPPPLPSLYLTIFSEFDVPLTRFSIVNVIQPNPIMPSVIAVSGIDWTPKIFGPVSKNGGATSARTYSRTSDAATIMRRNRDPSARRRNGLVVSHPPFSRVTLYSY
jgi:hypothetical protein